MTEMTATLPAAIRRPAKETSSAAAIYAPAKKTFWSHIVNDPWLVPKLGAMALVAAPATFALCMTASSESAGVMLGIVPDMLATIVVACGMVGSLLFLDGYLEEQE